MSPGEKVLRDATLRENARQDEPVDARNHFYLAQSYRAAGELAKVYEHYALRMRMGGCADEVYDAQCEMSKLTMLMKRSQEEVVRLLLGV